MLEDDIEKIRNMIPHRYPMLLVDKIIEYVPNKSIIGLKNVTFNEPHFVGHFPQKSIMPGVLIIESMAQTAAIYVVKSTGTEMKNKLVYFMSIDGAKFRSPVVPGDSIYLHMSLIKNRGNVWKFNGIAKVEDKVAAEAVITAMVVDN